MITLQTDGSCEVGCGGNVFVLTNKGTWTFPSVDWVRAGTNAPLTNDSYWSSSSSLVVDQAGNVAVTRGANVEYAGYSGIIAAFATVGLFLVIRYVVRFGLTASGVPRIGD